MALGAAYATGVEPSLRLFFAWLFAWLVESFLTLVFAYLALSLAPTAQLVPRRSCASGVWPLTVSADPASPTGALLDARCPRARSFRPCSWGPSLWGSTPL